MTAFGLALSSEELGPTTMVDVARAAEERGFDRVWVSDHFHPWVGEQVQSPFVWSVLGGRLYTCPAEPVPVYVSAFGPKATEVAARIGDGFANVAPEASIVEGYRDAGGTGSVVGSAKVCVHDDREAARDLVHRLYDEVFVQQVGPDQQTFLDFYAEQVLPQLN